MEDEERIEAELDRLGLDPVDRGRYWHIHCPQHEDGHKSAVCFRDGWICCFAGCPRRHINQISGSRIVSYERQHQRDDSHEQSNSNGSEKECGEYDWTPLWLSLDPIREPIKGVPSSVLNRLGWRWFPGGFGIPAGYFIPYFSRSRRVVRYFQVRHDDPKRRFSFPPRTRPTIYGMEVLKHANKYLCFTEGSRDSVILRMCGIPAVAIPSASSGRLLRELGREMTDKGIMMVAVSDKDEAGDRLLESLDVPYLDMRTPVGKDVGDFYDRFGLKNVAIYYKQFIKKKGE